jgi:hypothetical protein
VWEQEGRLNPQQAATACWASFADCNHARGSYIWTQAREGSCQFFPGVLVVSKDTFFGWCKQSLSATRAPGPACGEPRAASHSAATPLACGERGRPAIRQLPHTPNPLPREKAEGALSGGFPQLTDGLLACMSRTCLYEKPGVTRRPEDWCCSPELELRRETVLSAPDSCSRQKASSAAKLFAIVLVLKEACRMKEV